MQLAGQAVQHNWPTATKELIAEATQRWVHDWKVEVAFDLNATYWLGPAYVWTNLRLCFTRSDVFGGVDSHPADHAREIAIERMLRTMCFQKEQLEVQNAWADMLAVSNQTMPQTFDVEYPVQVIDALVSRAHAYCVANNKRCTTPASQPSQLGSIRLGKRF